MIQCNKCNFQYIGETKRHLSDRFGEHKRAIEKAIAKQPIAQPTAVSDHFTLLDHSMNNIELIPLELITSVRDGIRKAREAPRGGDSHMKQTGMLVVSLRGVNFGFWSRLGCSGQTPIFYAAKVSFRVPQRNTELCEEKPKSNFLFNLFCLPHCLCDLAVSKESASVLFDDIVNRYSSFNIN